MEVCL